MALDVVIHRDFHMHGNSRKSRRFLASLRAFGVWGLWIVFGAAFLAGCGGAEKKPEVSPKDKEQAQGHFEMGVALINGGRGEEALGELEEAVEINTYDPEIHNAMGLVYFHKERFAKAEEAYKKAIELDPENTADTMHNLGTLYLYLGRYDEAINQFQNALADDTYRNRANTINALGWAYYKKQSYVEAEQAFKDVIDRDARYYIAYDNLAKVYIATNRIDDAITQLEFVLRFAPEYPEANLDLGICYLKKGEKDRAREHFLKVVQIDPLGKLGSQAQDYLNLIE